MIVVFTAFWWVVEPRFDARVKDRIKDALVEFKRDDVSSNQKIQRSIDAIQGKIDTFRDDLTETKTRAIATEQSVNRLNDKLDQFIMQPSQRR